ncbi:MAG: tyrosine-type recombinase/integrase [Chloroflexota bacterium]
MNSVTVTSPTELAAALDIDAIRSFATIVDERTRLECFENYQNRLKPNTLKNYLADLRDFGTYLVIGENIINETFNSADMTSYKSQGSKVAESLLSSPSAWDIVTFGLVAQYQKYMLSDGQSIATINRRISTIKAYAKVAHQASYIDDSQYLPIKALPGLHGNAARNADSERDVTRKSTKKSEWTRISEDTVNAMINNDGLTPRDIQDALMVAILAEHGLRESELVILTTDNIDFDESVMRIKRPKNEGTATENGTHTLTRNVKRLINLWVSHPQGAREGEPLFFQMSKSGFVQNRQTLSTRGVQRAIKRIGLAHNVDNLSPHDLRHHAACVMAKHHDVADLCAWFGWNTERMALYYIDLAAKRTRKDK